VPSGFFNSRAVSQRMTHAFSLLPFVRDFLNNNNNKKTVCTFSLLPFVRDFLNNNNNEKKPTTKTKTTATKTTTKIKTKKQQHLSFRCLNSCVIF
jgi:hypothetical protein